MDKSKELMLLRDILQLNVLLRLGKIDSKRSIAYGIESSQGLLILMILLDPIHMVLLDASAPRFRPS